MALFILSHPHRTRVTPSWYGPDACPVPPFPPGPGSNRSTLGCPSTAPIHRDRYRVARGHPHRGTPDLPEATLRQDRAAPSVPHCPAVFTSSAGHPGVPILTPRATPISAPAPHSLIRK